jgi:hypothetical protein
MGLATRMLLLNAELTKRRAARERRRNLNRDLACFATAAERDDLFATLERYPDAVAEEVRRILERQAVQDLHGHRGAGGFRLPG